MDKAKGVVSLRKKKTVVNRPKISAPQQIVTNQSNESVPTLNAPNWNPSVNGSNTTLPIPAPSPRPRPSINGTDRTADLVKRRYSTRFAQPTDDGLPIPGIPQLPAQYASSVRSGRSNRSPERAPGQRIRIDLKALRDPNLLPDKCWRLLHTLSYSVYHDKH